MDSNADHELQLILMKALYCVAEKYRSTVFSTTFSPQLLTTLLRLLQVSGQTPYRVIAFVHIKVRMFYI